MCRLYRFPQSHADSDEFGSSRRHASINLLLTKPLKKVSDVVREERNISIARRRVGNEPIGVFVRSGNPEDLTAPAKTAAAANCSITDGFYTTPVD